MPALEKVGSGQRFQPRAETWNAFVDAARYVRERALDQNAAADRLGDETIILRNTSDVDVPRHGLLWLTAPAFEGLVLASRPAHPFLINVVIAAEPIAAGAVGHAWHDGQHPMRIAGWGSLTEADFPLLAITQTDSFDALPWTGTGGIPVLGKLDESPLVLADLTNRSAA